MAPISGTFSCTAGPPAPPAPPTYMSALTLALLAQLLKLTIILYVASVPWSLPPPSSAKGLLTSIKFVRQPPIVPNNLCPRSFFLRASLCSAHSHVTVSRCMPSPRTWHTGPASYRNTGCCQYVRHYSQSPVLKIPNVLLDVMRLLTRNVPVLPCVVHVALLNVHHIDLLLRNVHLVVSQL